MANRNIQVLSGTWYPLKRSDRCAALASHRTLLRRYATEPTTARLHGWERPSDEIRILDKLPVWRSCHERQPIALTLPPRVPLLVAEVAQRVQVGWVTWMASIANGHQVVQLKLSLPKLGVIVLAHAAAAALMVNRHIC